MRTLFNVMDKIQINLEKLIKEKKLTSKEVAKRINITEANLSILKTGKAKGIRFTTLLRICRALDCQPGEGYFLEYVRSENHED
jgi:putative transcriptional regulator